MRGELVAEYDMKNRPLIFSRLQKLQQVESNLIPINKLEYNTEGLLLLTNNRLLVIMQLYYQLHELPIIRGNHSKSFIFHQAKYLESSKSNMDRIYKVRVHGKLTPSKLDGLMRGLRVKGEKYM